MSDIIGQIIGGAADTSWKNIFAGIQENDKKTQEEKVLAESRRQFDAAQRLKEWEMRLKNRDSNSAERRKAFETQRYFWGNANRFAKPAESPNAYGKDQTSTSSALDIVLKQIALSNRGGM